MLGIHACSCILNAPMTEYAQPLIFTVRDRNPFITGMVFEGPDSCFTLSPYVHVSPSMRFSLKPSFSPQPRSSWSRLIGKVEIHITTDWEPADHPSQPKAIEVSQCQSRDLDLRTMNA